jgi:transcriptional regulator with XRE-family HTH domain
MYMKLQEVVGLRVRTLRKAKGFSQEGFAGQCGIHRTFMGSLERGEKNISLETLAKISKGLGITLSELLQDCG